MVASLYLLSVTQSVSTFTVIVSEACGTLRDQRLLLLCPGSATDYTDRLLGNLFDFVWKIE